MTLNFITIEPNGIMDITEGIVVHQVNCLNRIGKGLSGQICKKYPIVKQQYHKLCTELGTTGVFGKVQEVLVSNNLIIVNMFSQMEFGNPKKTGKQYTNYEALVNGLETLCQKYPDKIIYIPEFIGCGYGGGDWNTICTLISHLSITVVKRPV
ncbi:hypothetical protein BCR36DRAFT_579521 [Piromyces finnis]|uniref:Macro domain-like protein n=1 Tax=Piromyces finnis TaxID=1754191 RepID=A0A1Y1VME7_9FUNG|nr:hypothetical protein BCR36DRAFT_579521 [Piromyces finnis]|eukprot:ORX60078.1 hypothetical protein BCR36DRAFT_579521 [Piromyces finnis]